MLDLELLQLTFSNAHIPSRGDGRQDMAESVILSAQLGTATEEKACQKNVSKYPQLAKFHEPGRVRGAEN